MTMNPSVAILIPSYDGAHHLVPCLDSVSELSYEGEVETIIVDNGSSDGTPELVRERYPWARVLRLEKNHGFADAINRGAATTTAECLALLNNDMRVEPEWVTRLVDVYEPDEGCSCVAGLILDWEGKRVDFVDGIINFHGAAAQDRFRSPIEQVVIEDRRELPFACGGSMLINRERFLELGGFDPAYFAFFEDVDLGWRLWLSGDRVRLAAGARSYHRHHSTGSSFAFHERMCLFERNWLRTLIKNLDEANLGRVLSASLLLVAERARLDSGSNRDDYAPGKLAEGKAESVPRIALARLHAIGDVVADLDNLFEARRAVQDRRVRSDAEIFRRFRRPFFPVREDQPYLEAMAKVTQAFRLDELFPAARANRLLVVPAAGASPAVTRRLVEVATVAARLVPTTVAARNGVEAPGVEMATTWDEDALEELVAEAEIVVVDSGGLETARLAREAGSLLVVVLGADVPAELLATADLFLSRTEDERAHWIERLNDAGRSDAASLVAIVPAGRDGEPDDALQSIISEPWRWRARSPATKPAHVTEDARMLLERWRYQYGAARPATWHVARALWRRLRPTTRAQLRRLARRP